MQQGSRVTRNVFMCVIHAPLFIPCMHALTQAALSPSRPPPPTHTHSTLSSPARWEYAIDERDAEICSLKQRLVEVERRSREAAQRAEADVKRLAAELQVGARGPWGEGGGRRGWQAA
jgi:hypothetical protein